MTDKEKAIIMAHTGICMLEGDKFQIFHKYIEDIMGRPIFTHEIGWLEDEIKERSKTDFIALCADESDSKEPNKSEIPTGSTTKNDLGIDCISREQAIRELKESAEHHANDSREEALLHRDRDIIRALPPVTPIQSWISISEKLPEENGGYLVTVKRGYVTTALWVGIAENWKEVIAWMALPKPYKEVEE